MSALSPFASQLSSASTSVIPVGRPVQSDAPARPLVVYGVICDDPEVGTLIRKVLHASLIVALFSVSAVVMEIIITKDTASLPFFSTMLFLILLIPCCGYIGAKFRARQLLGTFCLCNCVCAGFCIVNIALNVAASDGETPLGLIAFVVLDVIGTLVYLAAWFWSVQLYQNPFFNEEPDLVYGRSVRHLHPTVSVQPVEMAGSGIELAQQRQSATGGASSPQTSNSISAPSSTSSTLLIPVERLRL